MKKMRTVRVKTAMGLVRAMMKHRCKGKVLAPMDDSEVPSLGYVCVGCQRFLVQFSLEDMKKEKKMMRMFWEALKTSDGRAALGGALNHPPSKAGGFRKEGFWILE